MVPLKPEGKMMVDNVKYSACLSTSSVTSYIQKMVSVCFTYEECSGATLTGLQVKNITTDGQDEEMEPAQKKARIYGKKLDPLKVETLIGKFISLSLSLSLFFLFIHPSIYPRIGILSLPFYKKRNDKKFEK